MQRRLIGRRRVVAAGGAISVQVLNELANVARRKMKMSWADTHALLNMLRGLLTVHPLTLEVHETGLGSPSGTVFPSMTP